jgi:hypothetical protein
LKTALLRRQPGTIDARGRSHQIAPEENSKARQFAGLFVGQMPLLAVQANTYIDIRHWLAAGAGANPERFSHAAKRVGEVNGA